MGWILAVISNRVQQLKKIEVKVEETIEERKKDRTLGKRTSSPRKEMYS